MTWKKQIQIAINYDHDPPKTNAYLLPNIEIEFWIRRAENLQGIKTQVGEKILIDYKSIIKSIDTFAISSTSC